MVLTVTDVGRAEVAGVGAGTDAGGVVCCGDVGAGIGSADGSPGNGVGTGSGMAVGAHVYVSGRASQQGVPKSLPVVTHQ